jgi:hypothetical protein
MYKAKLNREAKIKIILSRDSDGKPLTDLDHEDVSLFIHKPGAGPTYTSKVLSSANFRELSAPGHYELTFSSEDMNTPGFFTAYIAEDIDIDLTQTNIAIQIEEDIFDEGAEPVIEFVGTTTVNTPVAFAFGLFGANVPIVDPLLECVALVNGEPDGLDPSTIISLDAGLFIFTPPVGLLESPGDVFVVVNALMDGPPEVRARKVLRFSVVDVQVDFEPVTTGLDDIKGVGFESSYHSLVAVDTHLNDIKGAGFTSEDHSLAIAGAHLDELSLLMKFSSQANYRMSNMVYTVVSGTNKLQSAHVSIWDNPSDVGTLPPVKTLIVDVEYDSEGNVESYTSREEV